MNRKEELDKCTKGMRMGISKMIKGVRELCDNPLIPDELKSKLEPYVASGKIDDQFLDVVSEVYKFISKLQEGDTE